MAHSSVAETYARALLDLTVANGTLTAVRDQLTNLASLLTASPELRVAFGNPTLRLDERKRVVGALVERLSLSKTTRSFLLVLAEKGRLSALGDIAAAFARLADAQTGVLRARVVSPVELSISQATRLQATLADVTGRRIQMTNDVDAGLLGGIRVHVGGKVYDASVATQLGALRSAILKSL